MATEGEDIKSHLFKLFSTDRDLISKIAEALSSTIVDLVIKSEEFINVVTEKLVKYENIIESVVNKIGESAKQEVYESLSYDQKCLEEKYSELNTKLEKLVADLEKNRLKQIDELDSINQYGRRNCILIHGPDWKVCKLRNLYNFFQKFCAANFRFCAAGVKFCA
jgi:hypothetical protein